MKLRIGNWQSLKRDRAHLSSGFTIVELLVSMSIFAFASLIAVASYLSAINLQKHNTAIQAVQQNATYTMEILGKEIRNGAIDYTSYTGNISNPSSFVNLFYRASSSKEGFYLDNVTNTLYLKRERVGQPGVYDTSAMTNADVKVTDLKFYVSQESACTLGSGSCNQPMVTVCFTLQSNLPSGTGAGPYKATFETSYATRIYAKL